jgi:hypothetical protein
MRFRLRTLLIAAAIGPPLLAVLWFVAIKWSQTPVMVIGGSLLFVAILLLFPSIHRVVNGGD